MGLRWEKGGSPKICTPLVAGTLEEAVEGAARLAALGPDLIEVRLDYLVGLRAGQVSEVLRAVAAVSKGVPLLATVRRAQEGGAAAWDEAERVAMLRSAIGSETLAALDVELRTTPGVREALLTEARQAGVSTIVSYHDWERTPPPAELEALLRELAACPADVLKLAVMPQTPPDTLALLAATYAATIDWLDRPLITMALGALGSFTRLAGPFFGSALTFAVGEYSSAPGQLRIDIVRQVWQNWAVRQV